LKSKGRQSTERPNRFQPQLTTAFSKMFTLANRSTLSQRQRSRKACQPCRQRKRKCDGRIPCQTCVRYDYDCFYLASGRRSSAVPLAPKFEHPYDVRQHLGTPSPFPGASPDITASGQSGMLDPFKWRFASASSTVRFPRLQGLDFGSSSESQVHSLAHNLGVRPEPKVANEDFTNLLSFSELERVAEVYFDVIHPIVNFIDRDAFRDLCRMRYSQKLQAADIDPIICGVA
jgi:hypothetical protein